MTVVFRLALVAVATAALGFEQAVPPQPAPRPSNAPRLLVVIVMDQFRADYFELYGRQWSQGLRRLFENSASFRRAAYPYAVTTTCPGHATLATGAYPAVHGMSGNDFYDRALRRSIPCALDPAVTSVPFGGGSGRERHSARSMLVPPFGEEIRRQSQRQTRIVAIAQKPRSSVTFAGRGSPDTIAVFEEDHGTWATSDWFASSPPAEVDEFVRANPMTAAYGQVWDRILPLAAYRFTDEAPGEGRPAPWTQTFPHPLISPSGSPDNQFVSAWERSPWDDEFLVNLAIHMLRAKRLGSGTGTDVLTVSLPSLDHIGHEYGPRSHEVQDVLARADGHIGRLLDAIETQVGQQFAVAFSGDHGVATIPEQAAADGADAGRISTTEIRNAVNAAIEKQTGTTGAHVAAVWEQQVALAPGLLDQLRQTTGGVRAVKSAIAGVRGIAAVYSVDEIVNGATSTDPNIRAWRLSYVPGRSGDFMFRPREHWIARGSAGTTHGTPYSYDQRVPLIFFGPRFRPGRYDEPASPADLAPTLSHLVGIKLPRAQGRVLTAAIR